MNTKYSLTKRAAAENTTPLALVIDAVQRGGNKSAAARLLCVSHTTIRYHLARAGLTVHTAKTATIEGAK